MLEIILTTFPCTKYALEAFRLQLQVNVVLSPNLSHEVKWHRFVNIKGGMGRNIPCDLYNEHINKLIKIIIQNMGSNLTEASFQRAVRCVSPLNLINSNFDKESDVLVITSAHSTRSDLIDINKVVAVVLKRKLLSQVPERAPFLSWHAPQPTPQLGQEKNKNLGESKDCTIC